MTQKHTQQFFSSCKCAADIDHDGQLDAEEFAVMMYFVDALLNQSITSLPSRLPLAMVPPTKRHLAHYD